MKKSTLTPRQIAGILKELDSASPLKKLTGNMASAERRCISGGSAMVASKPLS